MKELLEQRLDEHKYELLEVTKGLLKASNKDIINQDDIDISWKDTAEKLIEEIYD
jgi:hypothetical protein